MLSLCWMWGGGGGQKDHYVGKSAKFPKTFDQDYSPLNTIYSDETISMKLGSALIRS